MFAIIKTGGKQYKVAEGGKLLVEKLDHEVGAEFDFDQVLMVYQVKSAEGGAAERQFDGVKIGQPLVAGAKVRARVLENGRSAKKIVFKFHNKTRYKKKKGHRQPYTQVEILKISA